MRRHRHDEGHAAEARLGGPPGGLPLSNLAKDHHYEQLFSTTIGGRAPTVKLAHQVVEFQRQTRSLRFAGLASDWADQSCLSPSGMLKRPPHPLVTAQRLVLQIPVEIPLPPPNAPKSSRKFVIA